MREVSKSGGTKSSTFFETYTEEWRANKNKITKRSSSAVRVNGIYVFPDPTTIFRYQLYITFVYLPLQYTAAREYGTWWKRAQPFVHSPPLFRHVRDVFFTSFHIFADFIYILLLYVISLWSTVFKEWLSIVHHFFVVVRVVPCSHRLSTLLAVR